MHALLDRALHSVPMLATLGVRVVESKPARVILRLPTSDVVRAHDGTVHTSAAFALGELAATVLLATLPEFADHEQRLKSSRIKYQGASPDDLVAFAELPPLAFRDLLIAANRPEGTTADLPVQVTDEHGAAVAELSVRIFLRRG